MTPAQLKVQIEATAEAAREDGQMIDIDRALPTVFIHCGGDAAYFFQGEEAANLLTEGERDAEVFDVSVEDFLLADAQNW